MEKRIFCFVLCAVLIKYKPTVLYVKINEFNKKKKVIMIYVNNF